MESSQPPDNIFKITPKDKDFPKLEYQYGFEVNFYKYFSAVHPHQGLTFLGTSQHKARPSWDIKSSIFWNNHIYSSWHVKMEKLHFVKSDFPGCRIRLLLPPGRKMSKRTGFHQIISNCQHQVTSSRNILISEFSDIFMFCSVQLSKLKNPMTTTTTNFD